MIHDTNPKEHPKNMRNMGMGRKSKAQAARHFVFVGADLLSNQSQVADGEVRTAKHHKNVSGIVGIANTCPDQHLI